MRKLILAAFAAATLTIPVGGRSEVLAEASGIVIEDGYARAAGANARTGAAFMAITNTTGTDDRLIAAHGDIAERLELHAHEMTDGVAKMRQVEGGIPIPAGETVLLERGGLHVMFLGLTGEMAEGSTVDIVLVFQSAGEIPVTIPVDLKRGQGGGHMHGHGSEVGN
jgi:copper(I)-binding protein